MLKLLKRQKKRILHCECSDVKKEIIPRVYGKNKFGEAVIINYDLQCTECGYKINIDLV